VVRQSITLGRVLHVRVLGGGARRVPCPEWRGSALAPFPCLDVARNGPEQRMRHGPRGKGREGSSISTRQLGSEVFVLVSDLTDGDLNAGTPARPSDPAGVEAVSAAACLGVHSAEVLPDGGDGAVAGAKAIQLGVAPVPTSLSAKYRLGEQTLAPDGHQRGTVEKARMEGPEAHAVIISVRWRRGVRRRAKPPGSTGRRG
jgi:hypothetical protein